MRGQGSAMRADGSVAHDPARRGKTMKLWTGGSSGSLFLEQAIRIKRSSLALFGPNRSACRCVASKADGRDFGPPPIRAHWVS